jgi:FMN reductase
MNPYKLAVVSAGLSVPSSTRLLADRLTAGAETALRERGATATADVVELRDHARALADNLLTGFPTGDLKAAVDAVAEADAVIAVTPIFNASYSGLFKTFFDVLDADALTGTPVLMGATGGTARHSLALEHALRPMFAYLRAAVVPTAVYASSEDWGTGAENDLTTRIARAATELAATLTTTPPRTTEDPFTDPTPFTDLLGE